MQVQELDDLADWFKANVLDFNEEIYNANLASNIPNRNTSRFKENSPHITQEDDIADELSLIEFIIGVNDVET